MAEGRTPAGRSGARKTPAARKSAGTSAARKSAGTSSAARKSAGTSAAARKSGSTRPAGSGPSQRPPARRKNKSIVNQKQTPWGVIAATAAVVIFAIAVVVVVVVSKSGDKDKNTASGTTNTAAQVIPTTPTGTTTVQKSVKRIANKSGISGVLAWYTGNWPGNGNQVTGALEHQHVTGPITYSITPPVGGPHNATWMNAGVYTKPVPTERAVHNLEHGAVWITYDPNLAASKVAALRAFVAKQSLIDESRGSQISGQKSRYMDLTPWTSDTLPAPIVMSSWGFQLRLTSPTDPRMQQFVDKFRNSSKYTPEYGSPVDGVPVSTGGRPAADGATKPNPS